jgi:hypothetical protein
MFNLKPLEHEAVPRALDKAERYRLLNEPVFAESICQDVLALEPRNQRALTTYLLALTDQFGGGAHHAAARARALVPQLEGEYDRCYYAGIIAERLLHAVLGHGGPGSAASAYEHLHEALSWYERAHELRPAGNDDAVLRYNTCVRTMRAHHLEAPPPDPLEYPGDV